MYAQSSGSITGLVIDQSSAPIPQAKVSIAASGLAIKEFTHANHEGYFTVAALPPGTYIVSAEREGFKTAVSKPLELNSGAVLRVDLMLVPNDSKQSIDVRADPSHIETQTGMLTNSVSDKEMEMLPVTGRNIMELALMMPGVSGEAGSDEAGIFMDVPTAGAGLSIGGGRAGSSAILSDGANSSSVGIGRSTVTFSPDTVQEFQVITSSYSAKYGVSGGGIVNTVSKAGTDQLRGNAYWYNRNPAYAARQFNRPLPPQGRRNEFGLIQGGPVVIPKIYDGRNKTFFFATFEPKWFSDAIEIYDRFPTEAERLGDFRNSYVAPGQTRPKLYQQVQCAPSPQDCKGLLPLNRPAATSEFPLFSANDPDPGKRGLMIPRQYLDPASQKILATVPLPNMPFDSAGKNYFGIRGVDGTDRRWSVKIDHHIGSKNRLSGRFTDIPNFSDRYRTQRGNLFQSYPSDRSLTRQALLTDTHTISPRIVNEFRASYTFSDYSRSAPGDLATTNYTKETFGLPNATGWGYPQFAAGWGTYGLNTGSVLGTYIEHQYQLSDDVTMIFGQHTLTTGVDLRLQMLNVKTSGLNDSCCGTYTWAAAQTNSGNANTPGGTGGIQFASFLLGVPNTAALSGLVVPYYYRWKTAAGFFQDDYKVRSNLTINLGVRYQYNSPRGEKFNRQATIDIDHPVDITNTTGQVRTITFNYLYSGFGGRSIYLEPAHKMNFEPRFGFAWSPKPGLLRARHVVVRGGYGVSHTPNTGRGRNPIPDFGTGNSGNFTYTRWQGTGASPKTQSVNPGNLISIGRNAPIVIVDKTVLQIPSDGILCNACTTVRDPRLPAGALLAFAQKNSAPYVQTWNMTMQTELPFAAVLTLTYMGQKGTHLYSPLLSANNPDPVQYEELLNSGGDPAQAVPDPYGRVDATGQLTTTTLSNLMRPFPTAGDINVASLTNSKSIYHAGTASVERRYRKGVSARFNYTWSKSIDTASDGNLNNTALYAWGATFVQNAADTQGNRSVSNFDTRHRINMSMILASPARTNRFAKGWSVSAIGSLSSGYPFSPYLGDPNGIPGGATGSERMRPDIVPGVPIVNPLWSKLVANDVPYFNPAAFARPAYGRLGNVSRTLDYARNPWRQTLNASLLRDFYPFENRRRYIQFRAEFFNAPNHATFLTSGPISDPLFSSNPPVSRTGLSLAGPIPYFPGLTGVTFKTGTRENILAANYNQNFGKLWRDLNGAGRTGQLALKIFW